MSHAVQSHQDGQVIVKGSDKTQSTEKGNGSPTPVFLPGEPHGQYEKAKRYAGRRAPQVKRCPICLWEKEEGNYILIAPDRMKQLSQSRNNAQLWMCLVVKVKSDAAKKNIV